MSLRADLERVVAAAVAVGDYPVAEGAMRRLEALQDAAPGGRRDVTCAGYMASSELGLSQGPGEDAAVRVARKGES